MRACTSIWSGCLRAQHHRQRQGRLTARRGQVSSSFVVRAGSISHEVHSRPALAPTHLAFPPTPRSRDPVAPGCWRGPHRGRPHVREFDFGAEPLHPRLREVILAFAGPTRRRTAGSAVPYSTSGVTGTAGHPGEAAQALRTSCVGATDSARALAGSDPAEKGAGKKGAESGTGAVGQTSDTSDQGHVSEAPLEVEGSPSVTRRACRVDGRQQAGPFAGFANGSVGMHLLSSFDAGIAWVAPVPMKLIGAVRSVSGDLASSGRMTVLAGDQGFGRRKWSPVPIRSG